MENNDLHIYIFEMNEGKPTLETMRLPLGDSISYKTKGAVDSVTIHQMGDMPVQITMNDGGVSETVMLAAIICPFIIGALLILLGGKK